MSKSNVIVLTPSTVKRTITPRRPPNAELRTREHLTDTEVEALIEVVKACSHASARLRVQTGSKN